ncbi:MAG: guanylate kinase [Opitutales bacterium]|nr:guanylate kinase [Opitutales bacterium]
MLNRLLLVLTGPSGCGKTTLYQRFLENFPETHRVITTTTRLPRPGETPQVDYFFQTKEEFLNHCQKGEFLEHAQVYGHEYGVSKASLLQKKYETHDLIMSLDVQGAKTFQNRFDPVSMKRRLVTIFMEPESLETLKQRLLTRGTDDAPTIQKRLQTAEKELRMAAQFDYRLCSQNREHDWRCLQHIYFAEKMRS